MTEKIRCSECGNIIAYENEPINDKGEISIMCNNRKPNGKRCKTINIIKSKKVVNKMETPLEMIVNFYKEKMQERGINISGKTYNEMLKDIERIILTPNN